MAYEHDQATRSRIDYQRAEPRAGGGGVWIAVLLIVGAMLVAIWAFSGTDGTSPAGTAPGATTEEPVAPAEPVPSTGVDPTLPAAPADPMVPEAADPAVPAVPAEPAPAPEPAPAD